MSTSQTILTGDRPTGQLHLGHYVGSLRQRVQLQHDHQQFILVADLQGLTDNGSNPQKISSNILEVMADYLAVGIDPLARPPISPPLRPNWCRSATISYR